MINNIYREKLLNAILYFAPKVKYPTKIKIFKLLFFFDFIHLKQTGRPVTNLKYSAWDFGPAPMDLWHELQEGMPDDFKNSFQIDNFTTKNGNEGFNFVAQKKSNLEIFTPREIKIMDELIYIYKDAKPTTMSEITHLKNSPWDKTIKEKGMKEEIDYILAFDEESLLTPEEAKEFLQEREEFFHNYPVKKGIE